MIISFLKDDESIKFASRRVIHNGTKEIVSAFYELETSIINDYPKTFKEIVATHFVNSVATTVLVVSILSHSTAAFKQ